MMFGVFMCAWNEISWELFIDVGMLQVNPFRMFVVSSFVFVLVFTRFMNYES